MIDLITGLPGNCKTLFTISWVKAWSEKDNRPVYYSGIPDLTLPWTPIEPEKWMDCPPGSIIVIDECQRIFRNRTISSTVPDYVAALETHRHKGVDLVFITQHPMLVDPALRRLVGRHRHMVRIWGSEASTIHEWNAVRESCDKPASRKDSESKKWLFDRTCYQYYKSAEVHTVKRKIPTRVKLLVLVPLFLVGAGYLVYYLMFHKVAHASDKAPAAPIGGVQQSLQSGQAGEQRAVDPVVDAKNYLWSQTPRVKDVPSTAPKYDELTRPTVAPRMAACISRPSGCKCYTQQGTPYPVNTDMCMDVVKNGYFQEFKDKEDDQDRRQERRDDQVPQSARVPVEPSPVAENVPVAVPDPPEPLVQHSVRTVPIHSKG
jgi:zona occludens toxin